MTANAHHGSKAAPHQRYLSTGGIEHRASGTRSLSQKQSISAAGKSSLFPLSEIS